MIEISTKDLKEKMLNEENFILDLYATWCGPCKIMLNTFKDVDNIESKDGKNYQIYKLNIDSDRDYILGDMEVRSVPTIKFYKGGIEFYSRSGVMTHSDIINVISNN